MEGFGAEGVGLGWDGEGQRRSGRERKTPWREGWWQEEEEDSEKGSEAARESARRGAGVASVEARWQKSSSGERASEEEERAREEEEGAPAPASLFASNGPRR
eukprot:3104366-Rhodomonas_salina.1